MLLLGKEQEALSSRLVWCKYQHLCRSSLSRPDHPGSQFLPTRCLLCCFSEDTKSRPWRYLCSSHLQWKQRIWNIGFSCVISFCFLFYALLNQKEKLDSESSKEKEPNLLPPNPKLQGWASDTWYPWVAHTHVQTGRKFVLRLLPCAPCRWHYLLILVSYSVLCLLSSVFSSTTKLCKALEHWTESREAAARSLCSLLLLQASNLSRLFSRSAVLTSLWDSEPWVTHSVFRELKVEESLARQAGQLLTESITEISQDDVDQVVLAMLCVLRDRLDEGTLS